MKPKRNTHFSWIHEAIEAKYWMAFYSKLEGDYNEQKFKEACEKYDEAMQNMNPNYKPMGEPIDDDRTDA